MSKSSKKPRTHDRRRSSAAPEAPTSQAKPRKPGWRSQAAFRESIEAVAIAFILAFLFRTFEAEAFVIPTGSMATTLMGRHKDVECPMCGYEYQVSASNGLNAQTGAIDPGADVVGTVCPMCRYEKDARRDRAFSGDRILVNKFVYCFQDPERWDVVVFKYPEEAKTNFIKRLVGLPNETIRIRHGDLYVRKGDESDFKIARKPPERLRGMLRMVYDNDHVLPEKLLAEGWPARWQPEDPEGTWSVSDDHKSFSNGGRSAAPAWLRYQHFVPDDAIWRAIGQGALPPGGQPRPQLITDFCAYNKGIDNTPMASKPPGSGLHWVGDLAVQCSLDVVGDTGSVLFELVEGGHQMQCRIDVATGQAELSISGDEAFHCVGKTPVAKPGTYEILFANVDDQLLLWVDGREIDFDGPTTYAFGTKPIPQETDFKPVGIATLGADVRVDHLKVLRDLYYIAVKGVNGSPGYSGWMCDYYTPGRFFGQYCTAQSVSEFFSNPFGDPRRNAAQWQEAFSEDSMKTVDFPLGEDQFLMLGDNSAQSKDSRLWNSDEYYVDRELLIGKALFIYWPHSWDQVSVGGTDIPFPFFPNFKRMEFVR